MLESLLPPDVMKKIVSKLAALISVVLAFIGLMMVMMTAFVAFQTKDDGGNITRIYVIIFHAHFWPMLLAFACAGAGLVVSKSGVRKILAYIVFLSSLWVMMNAIMGWVRGPISEDMGQLIGPLMMPLQAVGGFMGVLGGIVGMAGAFKK